MLNLGSLALGLCAWMLAAGAIAAAKAAIAHRRSVFSFSCCAVSLVLQLFEINSRITIGDYSAVVDTIGAVVAAAVVLLFVTVILNAAALIKARLGYRLQ